MNIEALSTPKGTKYLGHMMARRSGEKTMMIVDESTTIKTHNAKRTKTLLKLSENIGYKRILTGTPDTKSPLDIYSQYAFLDKNILVKIIILLEHDTQR